MPHVVLFRKDNICEVKLTPEMTYKLAWPQVFGLYDSEEDAIEGCKKITTMFGKTYGNYLGGSFFITTVDSLQEI